MNRTGSKMVDKMVLKKIGRRIIKRKLVSKIKCLKNVYFE